MSKPLMTRSIIFAILAFGLLVLAILTVFGLVGFHSLSRKMVTERLVAGLNEARQLVDHELSDHREDALALTEQLAPRLRRIRYFRAVVLLDPQGRVIHREVIGREVVQRQPRAMMSEHNVEPSPSLTPSSANTSLIPFQQPVSDGARLALEYDPGLLEQEVSRLRGELNRQLQVAVLISLVLLGLGLAYVIWAYRRNQTLQEKAQKADRLAYVGTLASGLAHEIRNPLNSMNMNVQLIQEEIDEIGYGAEDIYEMLESTRSEIGRLEKMVSTFLAYARPTKLQAKPTDPNQLLREILQFLAPEIEAGGVELDLKLDDSLPEIPLDEAQMKQALMNVIQNGVQVLRSGQTLSITTRKAGGDKVLISIADEGPGISEEELKNIFKVFYSTKRGGTGLGLATAQRIAELHQGGIKVESEVGQGSTFIFILPMEHT